MVIVFLANGFEEIEALTTVDVLRRAGLTVQTIGVGGVTITGAHGLTVMADCAGDDFVFAKDTAQAVVLPGGLPGTTNLSASSLVRETLLEAHRQGVMVCAICAAPSILGELGILQGKSATCYPGYEEQLLGAQPTGESVVSDGGCITAKGAGVTVDFALAIVARLVSPQKAREIGEAMQCR